uniref:Post-GPI attachment to proteins GalNAc transferase 4 n=1 Tax=Anolis carolinensis TaxID=28377 RepID=G1KTX8_ANOCA|nr:PREDICTED: transmembrane protein 246 [Anolis carolinensis]|eukprot:XP_008101661.1 PREDICTED: transmembrane protein 246 [Anolis carolinensis]
MFPQGLLPWGKFCRWSNPWMHFLALTIATFGVLAPLTCQQLLHSYFYVRRWYLNPMSQDFIQKNQEEGMKALRYFQQLQISNMPKTLVGGTLPPQVLLITIITVQRNLEFHYVLQVASRFHRLLQECGPPCQYHKILICNVDTDPDSHMDANLLARFFSVVKRYSEEPPEPPVNRFEKEKRDYIYCLVKSLDHYNPDHILLVEDDAVPEEDFFPVLHHLLQTRLSKSHLQDALYVKLYHPERLQHYLNPEPMRILEWLGIGMFCGPLLGFLYTRASRRSSLSWSILLFFAFYSMLLVELVGRHYFLELRRLAPSFYSIVPATECCTPAMLFSIPSAYRVLEYFHNLQCRQGFAKDTALYSLLHQKGEQAFVVEPNLVRHVGMFSSVRFNDHPKLI